MKHTIYHSLSNHNSEFSNSVQDVKSVINNWKEDGELNIRVYRITTEDMGSDYIDLEEERVTEEELNLV